MIQTHLVLRGIDQSEWIRAGHPSLHGLAPIKLLTDTTDRVAIARDAALVTFRVDKRCS